MARPRKLRKVCNLPQTNKFGPINSCHENIETVSMTVEEYETIRLIDLEDLTQQECADIMHVARATVQRIYIEARKKLADFLVNGNMLNIEGGSYKLCSEKKQAQGCGRCHRHRFGRENGNINLEEE